MINSDDKFNLFNFAKKHKLGNADKKRGIKARYGIEYRNGDKYVGEFNDGVFLQTREGKGIYYYKSGDKYVGDWKNGDMDGQGIYYFKSGDRYEGDWRNDERNGKGIYYYNDGDIYEGDWKNGEKDGTGIFYYKKSGNRYEGDYRNGEKDGTGIYYFKSGDRYEGEWRKDKIYGTGIYYFKNGARYEGELKNSKRDGKGIQYCKSGDKYKGDYEDDIFINGKQYYKSMPTNRKDVFLQINERNDKKEFLSKHKDGDFIYTDDRQIDNITKLNTNYDHLKILYCDHGNKNRRLKKDIDKKLFEQYKKNNLKSVYISSLACHGGFYDSNKNNLFKIVENMMTSDSSNCVGFVSLMKAKNFDSYIQTTNKNGKKGAKRVPTRKENIENLSAPNYDKNNDFDYYCIIKENGKNKMYQIPAQLCYWREYLIDTKSQKDPTKTLFDEALEVLKEEKDYKFDAKVILNDGESTERNMEITIPSKWGIDKENRVVERKITSKKRNNSSANKNLKDSNIQNQLGQ